MISSKALYYRQYRALIWLVFKFYIIHTLNLYFCWSKSVLPFDFLAYSSISCKCNDPYTNLYVYNCVVPNSSALFHTITVVASPLCPILWQIYIWNLLKLQKGLLGHLITKSCPYQEHLIFFVPFIINIWISFCCLYCLLVGCET